MSERRVVVIGGGLAGLAAAMKLGELGIHVDLISMVPVKRSHSVCAQGGINSVNEYTRQQGDNEWKHFDDTVYGGDFLQHQPPVKEMAEWAPKVIDLLDRLGVPFNRTPEGYRDQRRFGGTLYKRTAFSGATTGQQLLYALDEQVRRREVEGMVNKYEFWEFLGPILDDNGTCRGAVAQDMFSMDIRAFPADAVIMATGGCGLIFGKSTMSTICTGGANARVYKAGAKYANGEFIQVHPTAVPGADKLRLMSESARGEGGRVWVPRTPQDPRNPVDVPESDRYYFLEERYPKYRNLVPRDIATREIFDICVNQSLSVEPGKFCVYLDLTEDVRRRENPQAPSREVIGKKLGGILGIYKKFIGVDALDEPMKIFPAVHYSMGGLWVDYEKDPTTGGLALGAPRNQQSNIPRLYVIGEADYQYHGGNRLGANSLLSCIFSGLIVAPSVQTLMSDSPMPAGDVSEALQQQAVAHHQGVFDNLIKGSGSENPYALHQELGLEMTRACTVVRNNKDLEQCVNLLNTLSDRYKNISLSDTGGWTNQTLSFARSVGDMIDLAKVIAKGALQRDESRGAHYKPATDITAPSSDDPAALRKEAEVWCKAFGKKNDKWLKTTVATYTPEGPEIEYEPVDTSLIPVRPRTYGLKGAEVIEEVWREMQSGNSKSKGQATTAAS
jgi:succinate dehydrogenase / fumarate reductase flavoprotein subunit